MTVSKSYLFLFFILILSCKKLETKNNNNNEEENTYKVLSYLINFYSQKINSNILMPPPLKHRNFKTKDSLFFYKNFYEKTNGIKKIGVYENLLKMPEYNELYFSDCIKSKNKLDFFKNENNKSKIEINKISLLKKNDSILFIKNSQNKIDNIDLYMSFSKVKFNKKYTKAIVFLGINYGALNGFSTLIYLEKKHYHWVIKCEKRLSIS